MVTKKRVVKKENRRVMLSIIRSTTTVPNTVEKGIFSRFERMKGRANSPARRGSRLFNANPMIRDGNSFLDVKS
jgi:hypothetical protein